jgi:sodium-dependent dicarboxylate transporter 2/3/5
MEVPRSDRQPRLWFTLLGAALLAFVAGHFAPAPWTEGLGTVLVTSEGETVARVPVEVGSRDPVAIEAADSRIEFPAGLPVRGALGARIRIAGPDRPSLDHVRLDLELPDGRMELIPILKWDEKAHCLHAQRRPPVDSVVVLGLLAFIVVLWVTEVLPLWITALIVPVVLVVTGTGSAKASLAPFFHPIIALFFGGFLIAEAMRRVRLDHLAAVSLVTWGGRSPIRLFGAIMGVSAFLSMWMSNTASTAVLLPIVLAVTAPLNSRAFTKMAVLGLAFAATIGGVGSAVGTPANPLAIQFLNDYAGRRIAFADWFAFGLPMVVLFVPVMGAYLWWRMGVHIDPGLFGRVRWAALREYARVRRPTREQWTVLAVFAAVMAVWLTQTWHGLSTGIVAVAGAVALGVLGKLKTEDLNRISWEALVTFGGGITLGVFMVQSGTSDWLATRLEGLSVLPPFVAVAGVAILALALTAVASNTATAAMLVPLAIPLATVLRVDPVLLVIVVAIASSVDFALVIGTPPTMIAYSTRLFTAREIFRLGIVLDGIGIVILVTAVIGLWRLFGIV